MPFKKLDALFKKAEKAGDKIPKKTKNALETLRAYVKQEAQGIDAVKGRIAKEDSKSPSSSRPSSAGLVAKKGDFK